MEINKITINKLTQVLKEELSGLYEKDELDRMIGLLFRHFTGWNRADIRIKGEEMADETLVEKLLGAKEELKKFRPVQYITGATEFLTLQLKITPDVLIPRPETEELVNLVWNENRHLALQEFLILDIGTGSGCIAISMKKMFPYAKVEALDISAPALAVASENAALNSMEIHFRQMDILSSSATETLSGYNLIISNPPYVTESEKMLMKPNVLDHEPWNALFVPDTNPLRFYAAIGAFAWKHLVRPGILYLEINERQGPAVKSLLLAMGFDRAEVINDLQSKNRFVRAEAKNVMADTSYWMVDH